MNFFDARLEAGDNDNLIVDTGVFRLNVPPSKAAPFRSHIGREVILGVRPEDMHDMDYQPPWNHPGTNRSKCRSYRTDG